MECSAEEAEARRKMQKEAQKKLAEKMEADKVARLKELEDKKQADILKAASKKK